MKLTLSPRSGIPSRSSFLLVWILIAAVGSSATAERLSSTRENPQSSPQKNTRAYDVASPTKMSRRNGSEAYGKLPLSFEPNNGYMDKRIKFFSRGGKYRLFLTSAEVILALSGNRDETLRTTFVGANSEAELEPLNELPGKSNYFVGNDPKQWRTNVTNYARVKQRSVYPGIDVVFYGNQRQLEYDFIVAPHADPKVIKLAFTGGRNIRLSNSGNLLILTAQGEVTIEKPAIYQESKGTRQEVEGAYILHKNHTVTFRIGEYDNTRSLVIDPVMAYSTFLGSTGNDFGNDIAVDASGNAYVVGGTNSNNFPTSNPLQPGLNGGACTDLFGRPEGCHDVFVAKLNASGTALVYSTYIGGTNRDNGLSIAVDALGNAYITGYTESSNFPLLQPIQTQFGGTADAFVTKLNATGSGLVYSTYLGGFGQDYGLSLAVDTSMNTYVTGFTGSPNFPITPGAFQPSLRGNAVFFSDGGDAFVTKINSAGNGLVHSTYLGGRGTDVARAITVDTAGNAYIAGDTDSIDLPVVNSLQSANARGLSKSTNNGISWNLSNNGLPGTTVKAIAVDPGNPSIVYAGTGSGIFKSTNSGVSWVPINQNISILDVLCIAINPASTSTIYVGTNGGGVYKTNDGGNTWNAVSNGLGRPYVNALTIDPVTTTTLYAATDNGLFKSTDGGNNWFGINTGLPQTLMFSIGINPSLTSTLYLGSFRGVFKSVDGGNNWSATSVTLFTRTIIVDPVTPTTIYASGFKSIDAGAIWTEIRSGLPNSGMNALVMDSTNSSVLYAGTEQGVFKTINGGTSWESTSSGLVNPLVSSLAINSSTLYAGHFADKDAFVAKLDNRGASLLYSTYLSGNADDRAYSLAVDSLGNAYAAGFTSSTNFLTTPGAFQTQYPGRDDTFVTKLNSTGTAAIYSTYMGGKSSIFGNGIAFDSAGNAYIAGGPYVSALNVNGSALLSSSKFPDDVRAFGIARDSQGALYVAGYVQGTNFRGINAIQPQYGGGDFDGFISKIINNSGISPLVVTNTNDSGPGSLRQAISDAASGDTIVFSLPVGSVIDIISGELLLTRGIVIRGPGLNLLTIRRSSGAGQFPVFHIGPNAGNATISGLTISGGSADLGGGVRDESAAILNISACRISENSANWGGGIYKSGSGTLNVTASTISANSAQLFTGGIFSSAGNLNVTNTTISSNTGPAVGGLWASGTASNVVITNSTISGNSGSDAGAIDAQGAMLNISNSTITANSSVRASALMIVSSKVTIRSTIIAGNDGTDEFRTNNGGQLTSLGFNIIGNSSNAAITGLPTDQIGTPSAVILPKLAPLSDNGGPTQTHALLPESPAKDKGRSVAGLDTDQRGFGRVFDDPNVSNAPGGDGTDVGAFEANALAPSPPQLLLEESPNLTQLAAIDSTLFLREPFSVVKPTDLLNSWNDHNTRVLIFARNLEVANDDPSFPVVVNLIDSNNRSYDVFPDDVRSVPNFDFKQIVFRLPDNLPVGSITVRLKVNGQTSNSGTIRIKS